MQTQRPNYHRRVHSAKESIACGRYGSNLADDGSLVVTYDTSSHST